MSHDVVTVSWDDPGDDTITGYVVLRSDKAIHPKGTFVTLAPDTGSAATSYVDASVSPGRRYVYRVKAINAHGTSDRSTWARATTPAAPEPDEEWSHWRAAVVKLECAAFSYDLYDENFGDDGDDATINLYMGVGDQRPNFDCPNYNEDDFTDDELEVLGELR